MHILCTQHYHTLIIDEYLSDRTVRGRMRPKGRVALELGTDK